MAVLKTPGRSVGVRTEGSLGNFKLHSLANSGYIIRPLWDAKSLAQSLKTNEGWC